ncbi:PAS domain S-box protein [Thiohalocapsa halophila]|uniref:PAS domain S-box protein n=1 Tax=Thiohalocapsa halophila TaxID=69359 RepID=UPI00190407CB|nr:PAS domain S-box protein [Thiohalocapsa halophila]
MPLAAVVLAGLGWWQWQRWRRRHQALKARLERAEQRLQSREQQWQAIFEAAPDAIVLCTAAGRIVVLNREAEHLLGYTRRELARQPVEVLVPAALRDAHVTHRQGIGDGPEARSMGAGRALTALAKSGEEIPVDIRLARVTRKDRPHVVAALRDLRARRQAEQALRERTEELRRSREELQSILDHAPTLFHVKDRQGRYTLVNRRWCALAQRPEAEVLGHSDELLFPPEVAADMARDDEVVLDRGEPRQFEDVRLHGDTEIVLDTYKFPLLDAEGRPYGLCGIAHDVTERKDSEAELRRARDQAQEASRAKSAFLANMSHELRTPINAIIGMTHLALGAEVPARPRDCIESAHHSARELLAIINDLLDFSRLEAGKLTLDAVPFQLDEVLETLAKRVGPKADHKGLELLLDTPSTLPAALVGDPLRLSQMLVNLASNAVKFTKQGEVVVRVRVLEHGSEQVVLRFSVSDTGIGLSERERAELFKPFHQVDDSTTRRFGGTGLGLAICKRLTEMMGGQIWVESEPGAGSTFHCTARFAPQPQAAPERPSLPQDEHVLVVDDNATARGILAMLVESLGLRAGTAADGDGALAALRTACAEGDPYRLVFLDWRMPGQDGVAVARAIAADAALIPKPRVVLVTAYADDQLDLSQQLADLELAGCLSKPVSASAVYEAALGEPAGHKPPRPPRRLGDPQHIEPPGPARAVPAEAPTSEHDRTADTPAATAPEPVARETDAGEARTAATSPQPAAQRRSLLQGLCEEYRGFGAAFERAGSDARPDAQLRLAHTLKGVAGNLGLMQIAELAGELYAACRKAAPATEIRPLVAAIETQMEHLALSLDGAATAPATEAEPCCELPDLDRVTAGHCQQLTARLQDLLDGGDAEALGVAAELAETLGEDSDLGRHIAGLRRRVEAFEFALAAEHLRSLRHAVGRLATGTEATGSGPVPGAPVDLDRLVKRLHGLLQVDDTRAADVAAALAQALADRPAQAAVVERVRQCIHEFDYTAARTALATLSSDEAREAVGDPGTTNRADR